MLHSHSQSPGIVLSWTVWITDDAWNKNWQYPSALDCFIMYECIILFVDNMFLWITTLIAFMGPPALLLPRQIFPQHSETLKT